MNDLLKQIHFEEKTLHSQHAEFPARYIAACNLRALTATHPKLMRNDSLTNLEKLMYDPLLLRHRQSFFLFREAAATMTALALSQDTHLTNFALTILRRLLRTTSGTSHRAAAEAVGSLPLAICPSFRPADRKFDVLPFVDFDEIAAQCAGLTLDKATFIGRSLTIPFAADRNLLVIKLARRQESLENLHEETLWMNILREYFSSQTVLFDIPIPLKSRGAFLFRLKKMPVLPPSSVACDPETVGIAFVAHQDYFCYANEPQHYRHFAEVREVMSRNAWLLGHLASQGSIHTAPIPLFHNRVQRERREDNGLYDWPLGGRLDQWLDSCNHPNFGLSGIRDFEHFEQMNNSGQVLYWNIGAHIISLLLVIASYFRNSDKKLRGITTEGFPIDARDLFNNDQLIQLITVTMGGYYRGFVGQELRSDNIPFNVQNMAQRIIEEMGVDRHMEEMLRIADQHRMTDKEFTQFLIDRGFSVQQAKSTPRGIQDIVLYTGPHLGGFNQSISIPELITATASMAATCVLDRFTLQKGQTIN